jgi:hypothetical protein
MARKVEPGHQDPGPDADPPENCVGAFRLKSLQEREARRQIGESPDDIDGRRGLADAPGGDAKGDWKRAPLIPCRKWGAPLARSSPLKNCRRYAYQVIAFSLP